jgi:hypothetical protein
VCEAASARSRTATAVCVETRVAAEDLDVSASDNASCHRIGASCPRRAFARNRSRGSDMTSAASTNYLHEKRVPRHAGIVYPRASIPLRAFAPTRA